MAKLIKFDVLKRRYEARIVGKVYDGDKSAQYELYKYCADYYYEKYRSLFSATGDAVDEIFQNSFIKLWENIEMRKLVAKGNDLIGKDNQPLDCSIRTYFMGIARLKYLEWMREYSINDNGFNEKEYLTRLYEDSDNVQMDILSDIISHMPIRCYEILTKYYYEGKNYDRILKEIPSIQSKDGLKTKKHKCMESLREVAVETYNRYLKYN